MKQANSALEKRALQRARRQYFLDVTVRTDTERWKSEKKRGLLATIKLLINKLKRLYYETKQNVTQKL